MSGVRCAEPSCTVEHAPGKWATIRADSAGWFHQWDGRAWCPEHIPSWVWAWRYEREHGEPPLLEQPPCELAQ